MRIKAESYKLLSKLNKLLLDTGSTPVVGSSRNSMIGEPISDIAHTSFLLFPPLKCPDFLLEKSVKSSVSLMNGI